MIRKRQETGSIVGHINHDSVAMREATPGDEPALMRLAAMDDRAALTGRVLVAESGGAILAALSVDSGRAISDPWSHTAQLVNLLELRAGQLRESARTAAHLREQQRPSLVALPARP